MNSPNEMRARLLSGHIQGSTVLGEIWDDLSPGDSAQLIIHWVEILENSANIVGDLIYSISEHPTLGDAWANFPNDQRKSRLNIFSSILLNDMTLPDGTIHSQRAQGS